MFDVGILQLKSIYGTRQAARKWHPELPDPLKQKYCRSFVAKLQFAATWIQFDLLFAVSHLTLFCTSAGSAKRVKLDRGIKKWVTGSHAL